MYSSSSSTPSMPNPPTLTVFLPRRSIDLSSPEITSALQTQSASGPGAWILLTYAPDSRDKLALLANGPDGLDGLRAALPPDEVAFALLAEQGGRMGLIVWVPDGVSGVKRARALVHGRGVAGQFHISATLNATSMSDLTPSAVSTKLKLDALSTPSSPNLSSPLPPSSMSRQPSADAGRTSRSSSLSSNPPGLGGQQPVRQNSGSEPPRRPLPMPPSSSSAASDGTASPPMRARTPSTHYPAVPPPPQGSPPPAPNGLDLAEQARIDAAEKGRQEAERRAREAIEAAERERARKDAESRTAESRRIAEIKKREQEKLKRLMADGELALAGHVSAQTPSGTWRRRWFHLSSSALLVFKSSTGTSHPIQAIALGPNVRIHEAYDELLVRHSFKLSTPEGEELFLYSDSEEDKAQLVGAVRLAVHGRR